MKSVMTKTLEMGFLLGLTSKFTYSTVDLDDARDVRREAERVLQFCKRVRAGVNQGYPGAVRLTAQDDESSSPMIEFLPYDSRLGFTARDWVKQHGLNARRLDIYRSLDVVASRQKSFVKVLNKEVESRALDGTKGLIDVLFPDGSVRMVHYDQYKTKLLLEGQRF